MAEQQLPEIIPLQGILRNGVSKSSGRPFTRLEVQTVAGDVVGSFFPSGLEIKALNMESLN